MQKIKSSPSHSLKKSEFWAITKYFCQILRLKIDFLLNNGAKDFVFEKLRRFKLSVSCKNFWHRGQS